MEKIICENCKIKEAMMRKNGKPNFTLVWDSNVSDYKRLCFCKECLKNFESRKKERAKKQREFEKAPLEIMMTILKLKKGEEWNLKLADAEYLIKCL